MKKPNFKEKLKQRTQPADKERKPEYMYRPPSQKKKKIGVILLWGLIVGMFLMTLGNFLSSDDGQAAYIVPEQNKATGAEAVEFAKKFAEIYFTWDAKSESFSNRSDKLKTVIGPEVDQDAGLITTSIEWDSRLSSARVVKIEEAGKDKSLITLAVKQKLSKGDKKETNETLFTVPVGYDKAFGVYDLPSFAAQDTTTEVTTERLTGKPLATDTEQNLKAFLSTFFQSYTIDTVDKLSYFLEDPTNSKGLEGAMIFVEIKSASILESEPGIYSVSTEVVMTDPETKINYVASYRMEVKEANGRYIVSQLKGGL